MAVNELAEDGNHITPIKGNCSDVEDADDGGMRAESDEVDGNGEDDGGPDSVDWGLGDRIDLGPETRAWDKAIARKGENSSCGGLL